MSRACRVSDRSGRVIERDVSHVLTNARPSTSVASTRNHRSRAVAPASRLAASSSSTSAASLRNAV
jgi:hypothetical protein